MVISRIGALFFLISAAALLPFSARALVNSGALPIHVDDIEIVDGLAYVVGYSGPDGPPTLRILDLSDPAAPVEIGSLYTRVGSRDVEVVDGLAYIAEGWTLPGAVRIIDVSDPTLPVEVGAFPAQCHPADVEVVGNYAYLADQPTNSWVPECDWSIESKFRVIDVSNPAAPIQVSERGLDWPADIEAAEGVVYAAGRYSHSELESIDVSDPAQPALIFADRYPLSPLRSSVEVVGDRMYIGDGVGSFYVYDVSDPTQPVVISEVPGGGRAIVVEDGFAYSAVGGGLAVHDLAGSLPAVLLGGYASVSGWNGLAIADGLIFGGTHSGGLQAVDLGPEYTRVRTVEIAIRAEGEPAVVNLASRGVIGVAILGAADFDVALIDRSTLRFGPSSAAPAHKALGHLEDVNGDARPDLISHYRIADTGFSEADEEACVSGQTSDGTPIRGCGTLGVTLPRGQSNAPSVAD